MDKMMDFTTELEYLSKRKKLIEIYTDKHDLDAFCLGFINNINSSHIFINAVSYHGEEYGITVRRLRDIYRIEYDGEYEARIDKLFRLKNQSFGKYPTFSDIDMLLNTARLSQSIVTVTTGDFENNVSVSGLVEKAVSNKLFIKEVGRDGSKLGNVILNQDDIYDISYCSKEEEDIRLLLEDA